MNNQVGIERAKRAFARKYRYTQKPFTRAQWLTATIFRHKNGACCVRIKDYERRVWADYNISAVPPGRITWIGDGSL